MSDPIRVSPACLFAGCWLALSGCSEKQEGIPSYRLATADGAERVAPGPDASGSSAARTLRWHAPETWEEEKPGDFQAALYRLAPGITVSVSRFPGDAGGVAANVNRWRGQVGLEPVDDPAGNVIPLEDTDAQARWFELKGEERAILAAIIPLGDETWFFKLDSPAVALETARPGFMDFLKGVEIGSPSGDKMPEIILSPPSGWEKQDGNPVRFAGCGIAAVTSFVIFSGPSAAPAKAAEAP